jgi:hypothetical protein
VNRVSCEDTLKEEKPMLSVIKILGLGIWVGFISMAIAPLLIKNATEQDGTLVYVAIMDCVVIIFVLKWIWRILHKSKEDELYKIK